MYEIEGVIFSEDEQATIETLEELSNGRGEDDGE